MCIFNNKWEFNCLYKEPTRVATFLCIFTSSSTYTFQKDIQSTINEKDPDIFSYCFFSYY